MKTRLYKVSLGALVAIYLAAIVLSGVALATPQQGNALQLPPAQQPPKRGINPETGKVSFVGGGDPINVPGVSTSRVLTLSGRAMEMANSYGAEFGLTNP